MIQNPAREHRTFLHSIDLKKNAHTWVARLLSIYLTHTWFIFGTRSDTHDPYTFRIMLSVIPKAFLFFVLGLWLSTTQWGLQHKKIIYILLLPSLLMSPPIVGFPYSAIGWASFLTAIWSYLIIYKAQGDVQ